MPGASARAPGSRAGPQRRAAAHLAGAPPSHPLIPHRTGEGAARGHGWVPPGTRTQKAGQAAPWGVEPPPEAAGALQGRASAALGPGPLAGRQAQRPEEEGSVPAGGGGRTAGTRVRGALPPPRLEVAPSYPGLAFGSLGLSTRARHAVPAPCRGRSRIPGWERRARTRGASARPPACLCPQSRQGLPGVLDPGGRQALPSVLAAPRQSHGRESRWRLQLATSRREGTDPRGQSAGPAGAESGRGSLLAGIRPEAGLSRPAPFPPPQAPLPPQTQRCWN